MALSNVGNLSTMTGLSEAELQKRAEQLVDVKTGQIRSLSALDAALVDAGAAGPTMEAFTAAGSATANPHTIEDPAHVYSHGAPAAGFAPEPATGPMQGGPAVVLDRASKSGANKMTGSGLLQQQNPGLAGTAPAEVVAAANGENAESKSIQFEMIKNEIQKMAQAQTALTNVVATMHEEAMTAIRNAKA